MIKLYANQTNENKTNYIIEAEAADSGDDLFYLTTDFNEFHTFCVLFSKFVTNRIRFIMEVQAFNNTLNTFETNDYDPSFTRADMLEIYYMQEQLNKTF